MISPYLDLCPTPSGNTGSFRQAPTGFGKTSRQVSQNAENSGTIEAHLDYMVVCGIVSSVSLLESALWATFGANFLWSEARPGTHGRFYESNVVTSTGVMLSHSIRMDKGGIDYRLSIPGGVLQSTTEGKLRDFGRYLMSIGGRCTRFDWAIDDYSRLLDISTILSHCEQHRVSGFGRKQLIRSWDSKGRLVGETLYLGSKKSDSILRIYDKNLESNGKINAIRMELQARDNIAHSYFVDYFADEKVGDTFSRISRRVIGKYRFVLNTSEVLSRCPDVDWWAEFVSRLGGQIKIRERREQPQLSDKKRWVERQVAGTLALIKRCVGYDNFVKWLDDCVDDMWRLKDEKHQNWYDNWRNSKGRDCVDFSVGLAEGECLVVFEDWAKQVFGQA